MTWNSLDDSQEKERERSIVKMVVVIISQQEALGDFDVFIFIRRRDIRLFGFSVFPLIFVSSLSFQTKRYKDRLKKKEDRVWRLLSIDTLYSRETFLFVWPHVYVYSYSPFPLWRGTNIMEKAILYNLVSKLWKRLFIDLSLVIIGLWYG